MLADPLTERTRVDPHGLALVDLAAGRRLTWSDLDTLAAAWGRRLAQEGVSRGDRVGILEPAGAPFAAIVHACIRLGAAAVPLNPRAPLADLRATISDCRPRVVVRDGVVLERDDAAEAGDPADLCLLYTSGTMGTPKGVRLTLANHRASAFGCQQSLGGDPDDRWLLVLAPHHVGGFAIFMRSALSGQAVVTLPRFDESAVIQALPAERVTLVSLVPTMLLRLIGAGGAQPLRRVKAILLGGAPSPAPLVRRWAGAGLPVCPSYGLTETCSQVAAVPPGRATELAGTAGFPHPQATVEVIGGEVVVSGPVISPGYADARIEPAPRGGHFATGDRGFIDPQGALVVTGRTDDLIITGGENVNPEEVEAVLQQYPGIRDAAVVGRDDTLWGQVLEALVVGDGIVPEALITWCRDYLPSFKVPRRVRLLERLPRSESGKLLRREL